MTACRQVSNIAEQDIADALQGIPTRIWSGGEFENAAAATDYFAHRLRVWRECFG